MLLALPPPGDPRVLVGSAHADDAGVFRLSETEALVATVDFFTPIVDDPYRYGSIAAANALSDVYAMGGKPVSALSIVCFPEGGDLEILRLMLKGGAETLKKAGVALLGGHSVRDRDRRHQSAASTAGNAGESSFGMNGRARTPTTAFSLSSASVTACAIPPPWRAGSIRSPPMPVSTACASGPSLPSGKWTNRWKNCPSPTMRIPRRSP